MSRRAGGRWGAVAAGVAMLAAIPAVLAALPVPGSALRPAALRARILASAALPYQGYAESTASLGLPQLPGLQGVVMLLDGTTDQYVWYRSPRHWRSAQVTPAGENDVYQVGRASYLWYYAYGLLARSPGAQPVRLPRAPDLLPPELARRALALAASAERLSRLPARRIAGVDAAGLRVTPASPATTIRAVDIWADPADGLPVAVKIIGAGSGRPVLTTSFLQLSRDRPALADVIPHPAPGIHAVTARARALGPILAGDVDGDHDGEPFPARLAGLGRRTSPAGLFGLGAYGAGLAQFILVPLPGRLGTQAVTAAARVGGRPVVIPGGSGVLVRSPLLTVLLATSGARGKTFLLTGTVTPALLTRAAGDLLALLAAGPR